VVGSWRERVLIFKITIPLGSMFSLLVLLSILHFYIMFVSLFAVHTIYSTGSLTQWFSGNHEPHGSENAGESSSLTAPTTLLQHLLHFVSARGDKPDPFQSPKHVLHEELARGRHLKAEGERVVGGMEREPPRVTTKG
jgi:hypothetical protein